MGQNAGATASITDAGIADFTGDFSIIRAGGTHAHFYYPEPTYTPASYTGTMWFGELTVGNAGVGGAMLQLINSAGACTLTPPATTFSCTSDARLKTDYGLVGDQLNYLDSLPVHSYKINASGERTLGPIAQELQKIHPEMVHEVEDELLPADKENEKGTMLAVDGVNPWALVKAIQELNAEAKRQESQIRVLTRRVNKLERAANENHRHGSHSSRRRRA